MQLLLQFYADSFETSQGSGHGLKMYICLDIILRLFLSKLFFGRKVNRYKVLIDLYVTV